MFLSRPMTAPTLARLQVERSATWRVMVKKYWCQLNRSLIENLSSARALQPAGPLGLAALLRRVRLRDCKGGRDKSHGQDRQHHPAEDFSFPVQRRVGIDRRRGAAARVKNQQGPD